MEDKPSAVSSSPASSECAAKTTRELAVEGRTHLDETIEAANLILSAMNAELCNPNLWITTASTTTAAPNMGDEHHSNGDVLSDSSSAPAAQSHRHHHNSADFGGGVLDEAKSSVAALRSVLMAIADAQKTRTPEAAPMSSSMSPDDRTEIEKLEEQVSTIRKVLADKNKELKLLNDLLRNLLADITTWQSPCSV